MQFPQKCPFSLLGPHILISTLFSNTLNLCTSLNVRALHAHTETKAKLKFYIYSFLCFYRANEKTRGSEFSSSKVLSINPKFKMHKSISFAWFYEFDHGLLFEGKNVGLGDRMRH
jgi:hypothetical protein